MKKTTLQDTSTAIARRYGIDLETQYNALLDGARAYLHAHCFGDGKIIALWLSAPAFWAWWVQNWINKDLAILNRNGVYIDARATYQVVHDVRFMSHVHPPDVVYQAVKKTAMCKNISDVQSTSKTREEVAVYG